MLNVEFILSLFILSIVEVAEGMFEVLFPSSVHCLLSTVYRPLSSFPILTFWKTFFLPLPYCCHSGRENNSPSTANCYLLHSAGNMNCGECMKTKLMNQLQSLLDLVPALIRKCESRESGFVKSVKQWFTDAENLLAASHKPRLVALTQLQANIVAAQQGVFEPSFALDPAMPKKKLCL